jgi:uncharacterized protein YdaT
MEEMKNMTWTKTDYPNSMKNLAPDVREKAIEKASTIVKEEHYEDGKAIAFNR